MIFVTLRKSWHSMTYHFGTYGNCLARLIHHWNNDGILAITDEFRDTANLSMRSTYRNLSNHFFFYIGDQARNIHVLLQSLEVEDMKSHSRCRAQDETSVDVYS